MNRRVILVAAVVLILVAAGLYWFLGRDTSDRVYATATLGSIDVTIQTVGSIQATEAGSARSEVSGVIERFGVAAGDVVVAGDVVAVLDRAPFDDAIAVAERRVVEAEYELQFAEQSAADNSNDVMRRSDVLRAAERVQEARAARDEAREALASSVITASVPGTVIEVQARFGDGVAAGQSIVRIAAPEDLRLIADIDELDLPNVSIGADARFRLDSFPATELKGTVTSTAPHARQQGGATVFSTTIEFVAPDELDIRPGMNADVTIVTAQRDDVLLIPERALTTVGDRVFVDVQIDGELEEREITLGYRGDGQVEVVDGLAEGDRVLLH
jgi:membrane fusion protein, multidrug efflux system